MWPHQDPVKMFLTWCLTAVMLRVLAKQDTHGHPVRLTAQEAAPQVFHAMFSQVRLVPVFILCR